MACGRSRPWPHCNGDPAPLPHRGTAPQFSVHICCGQMAGWIKMPLGMEVGLDPGDCVRWRPSSPPQKGGEAPKLSAHVYYGQTTGWIKMTLCMKVRLSQGDFVLDGDPALPQKGGGAPSPIFSKFLLCPNGWMRDDATWYGGRPQPRGLCVRWGLSPPSPKRGRSPLPNFWPMLIVAKRLDASRCHLVWR